MYRLYTKNFADENRIDLDFTRRSSEPSVISGAYQRAPLDLSSWSEQLLPVLTFSPAIRPFTPAANFSVVVGAMSLFQNRHSAVREQGNILAFDRRFNGDDRVPEKDGHRPGTHNAYTYIAGRTIISGVKEPGRRERSEVPVRPGQHKRYTEHPVFEHERKEAVFLRTAFSSEQFSDEEQLSFEEDVLPELKGESAEARRPAGETRGTYIEVHGSSDRKISTPRIGMFIKGRAKVEEFSVASISKEVPNTRAGMLHKAAADSARIIIGGGTDVNEASGPDLTRPELVQFIGPFFKRQHGRVLENGGGMLGEEQDDGYDLNGGVDEVSNSGDQRNTGTGG